MYPSAGFFSISRRMSWAASPAPTMMTSLPRATTEPAAGRSMIVRVSSREPVTNASRSSTSTIQIPRGTPAGWKSSAVNTRYAATPAAATPRTASHMSRVDTYRHQRL